MARNMGNEVEHAVNNVVEALVLKMFEINERLRQREADFIKIHENAVKGMEENILKQYENQKFSLDGEKGIFELKELQNEKVILENDEKSVAIDLNKLDSIVKPIEPDKIRTEDLQEDQKIINKSNDKVNDFIEDFKGKSSDEITKKIQESKEYRDNIHQNIAYSDDPNMRASEYKTLNKLDEELENMKEAQKTSEKSINRENEPVLENVKSIGKVNHEVGTQINKNIENSKDVSELIPSQIRAQLEVVDYLKSMSEKEVINSFKIAQKQAKKEGIPVSEAYRNNLHDQVEQSIQIYKEKTLDTAINIHEKNKGFRQDLREVENQINANKGVLYQAKLEQKVSPEQFEKMNENLDRQKASIEERLLKLDQSEQKINEQLKTDIKQQFPDIKTDKLKLNDSIGLAKAAYTMANEKTIDNLKNFSLENDLKGVIDTIDKATKEIEIEIQETTTIAFSR